VFSTDILPKEDGRLESGDEDDDDYDDDDDNDYNDNDDDVR